MLAGLKEIEAASKLNKFSFVDGSDIELGVVVRIIEETTDKIDIHEGKFYLNLSQSLGVNRRVSDVVMISTGRNCERKCELYSVDAEVCLHSATCTCEAFYVKKLLCRHILVITKNIIINRESKIVRYLSMVQLLALVRGYYWLMMLVKLTKFVTNTTKISGMI